MNFTRLVIVNISITALVLAVVFSAVFFNREHVFDFLKDGRLQDLTETDDGREVFTGVDYERRVVSAVKEADPAVISVVSTQMVPRGSYPFFEDNFPSPSRDIEGDETVGGSGFIVSSEGHIVTNRHVVDQEGAEYSVLTNDGKRYDVEVLDMDPLFDIAVLKIVSDEKFDHLEFGDSNSLEVGQTAIAIGNALGEFQNSVSVGVISGLSRSIVAGGLRGRAEFFDEVIQTDAAINPGNSGGPLLDIEGRVVGVNTALAMGSQNIGFAVPSDIVMPIVSSVKDLGYISRAFLGIRYVEITPLLKAQKDVGVDNGILLVGGGEGQPAVEPGTPAERAGLEEGDIITHIDGEEIIEIRSFARKIRKKSVGDRVELTVVRSEEIFTVEANLIEAPRE